MITRVLIPLLTASLALLPSAPAAAQARSQHVEPGTSQRKTQVLQGGKAEESAALHVPTATGVEFAEGLAPRPSQDLSGFEAMCRAEGWGYWWDGKTCVANEEILTRTRGQTPGLHGGW